MGLNDLLNSAQKSGDGSMHYAQALSQLGHSVVLGILLMLLTMWASKRTMSLQARSRERTDSSPAENMQGAINVLFFCFGMTGVMILVEDNIARAFAIGAAIALVRFRILMGNMLSAAFLFSVVIGMACGVGKISLAWSIACAYSVVSILVYSALGWRSSNTSKLPAADVTPGHLIRNAEGNWTCHFPRYAAAVDGVTGNLISLRVKGDELIRHLAAGPVGRTDDGAALAISVAECDSPFAGRCGLVVSHPDFSLWYHFLSDAMIIEYMPASDNASELTIILTRNLSALSAPYPARSRHMREIVGQDSAIAGDTGISAVTRGGTPIVFYSRCMRAIAHAEKRVHGVTLSAAAGVRCAGEIQIGTAASSTPSPTIP